MVSDRAIGVGLVVVSIIVILVYFWLLFIPPGWIVPLLNIGITEFLIRLTVMIGVLGVFGILAWIGYTLATTPPPKPIEEIEKEIEEELKKLEKEMAETTAKPESKQ
ncbi:MAG: transcriptional regulator, partial [Desulfurococcales archaeon]|jgi:predicted DNA-binding transcriptional regulator|nr:transcriptional regulator [Desulfurococcales archaeon]